MIENAGNWPIIMLHIATICPICVEGSIGFRQCLENKTIILMCDECDTVWLNPQQVDAEHAIYPAAPDFLVPGLNCSLVQSRWAVRGEVAKRGWDGYIAGESKALDEI